MKCSAAQLREVTDYRIPIIERAVYAGPHHGIPIDQADALHHEPLVVLDDFGVAYESHHARSDGGNWPYGEPIAGSQLRMWLRRSLAKKLASVNRDLRRLGLEIFCLDGYRTLACQRGLWRFYCDEAANKIAGATREQCIEHALKHAADPTRFSPGDPSTWSSHMTGAAVDLTLRFCNTGDLVEMGTRYEDIREESCNDYFERELDRGTCEPTDSRLIFRRILHKAMSAQGLANDPFVFWHYDWGNQLYVKIRRALFDDAPPRAWYAYIDPPEPPPGSSR